MNSIQLASQADKNNVRTVDGDFHFYNTCILSGCLFRIKFCLVYILSDYSGNRSCFIFFALLVELIGIVHVVPDTVKTTCHGSHRA